MKTNKEKELLTLEGALGQLRHAYAQLMAAEARGDRRQGRGVTRVADEDNDQRDPVPQTLDEAMQLARDRANQISGMLRQAAVPASDTTAWALTLVTAQAAFDLGLSLNDAFSLFLAVYDDAEAQQAERMTAAVEHMQNTVRDIVQRVFALPGDEKPPTTH